MDEDPIQRLEEEKKAKSNEPTEPAEKKVDPEQHEGYGWGV